jgi:hypothetical protein
MASTAYPYLSALGVILLQSGIPASLAYVWRISRIWRAVIGL